MRSLAWALLLGLHLSVLAAPDSAPPPVASFFQPAALARAALSPDGRHLAVLSAAPGQHVRLAVMDVEQRQARIVAALDDGDIASFSWINDQRLVFSLGERQQAVGEWDKAAGLFAVNRDGSGLRTLITRLEQPASLNPQGVLPWWDAFLGPAGSQDTDDIYVLEPVFKGERVDAVNLLRVNTVTGAATTLPRPGLVRRWWLGADGEPAAALSWQGNLSQLHYRDPASKQWRVIAEFDSWREDGILPQKIGPDGTLYVKARQGQDTEALYAWKPADGPLPKQALVAVPGFDFEGEVYAGAAGLLGVRVNAERALNYWLDPAMAALQRQVDAAFPDADNVIRLPARPATPYALVVTRSDVNPGEVFLLNTATHKLLPVGAVHPEIDPKRMARKRFVRYRARDGLPIPAWLTVPPGRPAKDLPLVMLVHGGPSVRGGSWDFNREVQFLASRGYAVLEPEFRGSTGYGRTHERAGWKQWGLAMQDDVADGARWAIAEGLAAPDRICIAGASYGGYATLMGLIKDPDLYRCGVEWVGVSDIDLMYSVNWGDMSPEARAYQLPLWIGDREQDAAQLQATSPVAQAARLRRPLLMAYGGADPRVPIIHGLALRDAIRAHQGRAEWIEYPLEGHGWARQDTNVDFWGRVEKFLQDNIGLRP